MTMPRRWRKMLEKGAASPKPAPAPVLAHMEVKPKKKEIDWTPTVYRIIGNQLVKSTTAAEARAGYMIEQAEHYAAEFVRIAKSGGTPLKVPPHLRTAEFLRLMEAKIRELTELLPCGRCYTACLCGLEGMRIVKAEE